MDHDPVLCLNTGARNLILCWVDVGLVILQATAMTTPMIFPVTPNNMLPIPKAKNSIMT